MRKRKEGEFSRDRVRLADAERLSEYLSMGRATAVKFAVDAGARRQFGKLVRFDLEAVDRALERMAI